MNSSAIPRGALTLWALLSIAPVGLAQDPGGGFRPPPLCPAPLEIEPRWAAMDFTSEARIVWTEPGLEALAETLAADLQKLTGLDLEAVPKPGRSGDVILTLGYLPEEYRTNPESHFVEVLDHVLGSGQTPAGVARATARVLQLVQRREVDGEERWSFPAVRVVDAPAVRWRIHEPELPGAIDDEWERAFEWEAIVAHATGYNALVVAVPRAIDGAIDDEVKDALSRARARADARGLEVVVRHAHGRPTLGYFSPTRATKILRPMAYDLRAAVTQLELRSGLATLVLSDLEESKTRAIIDGAAWPASAPTSLRVWLASAQTDDGTPISTRVGEAPEAAIGWHAKASPWTSTPAWRNGAGEPPSEAATQGLANVVLRLVSTDVASQDDAPSKTGR